MDNIFVLNPLAAFIWEKLDGKHTLETIVADIVENFEVTREQAHADAADFVGQLLQNDLVEEGA
jgi:methyltransferase-like protein